MSIPTSREEFKRYCLRRLGEPLIKVNISDEQLEDRIDETLWLYAEYHFDGSEVCFIKYKIEQIDVDRGYLELPENVIGVTKVHGASTFLSSAGEFLNIAQQMVMEDILLDYTSGNYLTPYFLKMQQIASIREMLAPNPPVRYVRMMKNRLHIDTDLRKILGQYLLIEVNRVIDPDEYTKVWSEPWFIRYACAKIKEQWGQNLSKFQNLSLTGGIQFNADRLIDDAKTEIAEIEDNMMTDFMIPPRLMIG